MTTVLMLLLQTAAPAVAPAAVPTAGSDSAMVRIPLRVRKPCEASPDPNEVVVCGKARDDRYRLTPIPLPAGMKPPVDGPGMDFDLGAAHGNVYSTTEGRPDGIPDRRIMVSVKMPF